MKKNILCEFLLVIFFLNKQFHSMAWVHYCTTLYIIFVVKDIRE